MTTAAAKPPTSERSWATICAAGAIDLRLWAAAGDDRAYAELVRRDPEVRPADLPASEGAST